MTAGEARERLAGARVARLATAAADGRPHVVPCTFAVLGEDTIVSAVDHKPKRTTALRRLANIAANPRVAVLADHYEDDWDALWWARADGVARVLEPGAETGLRAEAVRALAARYAPYRERPPAGALVVVAVERWSGWSARS
ncbi:MAG: TIGR03668 family PPOX class F420-dependent oxidoreductase [Solirubrobacteraceae bacterium]